MLSSVLISVPMQVNTSKITQ